MEDDLFWTFRPANAEELKKCIREAFADAIYPGSDNITISACPCTECTETRTFFESKHWRDVAVTGLPFHAFWGGLAIMSPEAWRFYLPAYMLLSLKGDGDPLGTLECALYGLSPAPPSAHDWLTERTHSFSRAQQECIAAYASAATERGAEEEVECDEAFIAAANYWRSKVAANRAEQGAA